MLKNSGNMASKSTQNVLSFKPKEVTKKLISVLSDRAKIIINKRYGLEKDGNRETLEAIGGEYNITRERVRQIENFAINNIKKSPEYQSLKNVFDELVSVIEYHGGVVHEEEFLNSVAKDKITRNHIHFLLVIADAFIKLKEDNNFHHRWTTNTEFANEIHNSIKNLCNNFSENDLVSEQELITNFLNQLKNISDKADGREKELAKKWLSLSKAIAKNPLGEWGLTKSPNVKMRGIRDYAFLVLRNHGSPMHFTEVAKDIERLFGKEAHPATCHNELIKDKRFVLVGRGLYALSEWGYNPGVVLEVIKNILTKDGPLTKEEIINRVLKERYVKNNTIIVNLQNPKYFFRDSEGKYYLTQ